MVDWLRFSLLLGTSLFAGIAIFSILGHMAYIYGQPVGTVVKEGQTPRILLAFKMSKSCCMFSYALFLNLCAGFGLAFMAYPDALSRLPISTLWSILFFFMFFIVGLDSLFTQLGEIVFYQRPRSQNSLTGIHLDPT